MNRRLLFPASNRVWQQWYRVSLFSHRAQPEHPASITLLLAASGLVWDVQVYSQMKFGATLSLVLLALVFTPCFGQTPGNPPPEKQIPHRAAPAHGLFRTAEELGRGIGAAGMHRSPDIPA
jgi:hypothetical protein